MSEPLRWERLGFSYIGELEYLPPKYDAEWLRHVAKRIESGESLGPLAHDAAACFERLAETPVAITAMNKPRPRKRGDILRLNRAVHYLVHLKLLGVERHVKRARSDIAGAWRVKEGTIKDDVSDLGKEAKGIIDRIISHKQSDSRDRDILRDFDSDMAHRAALMRKPTDEMSDQELMDEYFANDPYTKTRTRVVRARRKKRT